MRIAALGMLLVLASLRPMPAGAQDAMANEVQAEAAQIASTLPPDRRTSHTLALPGRTLAFTATAGSIPIANADGTLLADVGYFAYTLEGAEPRTRPVVFAYNGGPGSSSVWLHIGAMGPWRVPLTISTMSARMPPGLVDNAETWLDFADLVFIDPPGTGHSRIAPSRTTDAPRSGSEVVQLKGGGRTVVVRNAASRRTGGPDWFWSLDGDIETFAEVITAWLRRAARQASPVVLVGESYGGFRTPLIARQLAREHRIGVRAMVLVSPVLDFEGRRGGHLPQHYAAVLPSIAATRMERAGITPDRVRLRAAEDYARIDYLADLVRGPRDADALYRIGERAGELSGMMSEHVRYINGRITARAFIVDNPLFAGQNVSLYDAGMAGIPASQGRGFGDYFTSALDPPLATAMEQLLARLDWRTERPYLLMSRETNAGWVWRNSPHSPESLSAMERLMQRDPRLKTLVTHGFTDLVTPYFATARQLDLLADAALFQRLRFEVYPGGHMFYSRDASRIRFREDAERMIGDPPMGGARDRTGRRETP
jgi:carboxypeptidase C (cathepsin A)